MLMWCVGRTIEVCMIPPEKYCAELVCRMWDEMRWDEIRSDAMRWEDMTCSGDVCDVSVMFQWCFSVASVFELEWYVCVCFCVCLLYDDLDAVVLCYVMLCYIVLYCTVLCCVAYVLCCCLNSYLISRVMNVVLIQCVVYVELQVHGHVLLHRVSTYIHAQKHTNITRTNTYHNQLHKHTALQYIHT